MNFFPGQNLKVYQGNYVFMAMYMKVYNSEFKFLFYFFVLSESSHCLERKALNGFSLYIASLVFQHPSGGR